MEVSNHIKKRTAPQQKRSLEKSWNIAPPIPSAVFSTVAESSSETDLGVVYAPTHITITRADGQMTRTVAVEQWIDQLLRYTQQNSQLLMVQ
ncbi:hypothetical protein PsorP6_017559 [Peronosclerospora sorghi]|uniref:Uncharacterized protein n=1 Tax=Peronosclerospora sorghi TaxID=230839 RepID=A0ACC0WM07_9STRA|nr:hypothetical protein PsorP6_017559 [Peronosclerospora sorghi]